MKLTWGALDLTAAPFLVEFGFDPGAPDNESIALPFMLQDGEIDLSNRAGNRTLQFNVLIEGASLLVLATAEATLLAESERVFNTITVDPEDSGPVAVYEVYRGQVTLARDDAWETSRMRRYTVTVQALPFTRSAAETVTAALPATGSTTTLLDACSATTGWTGFVDGGAVSPATAGGAVTLTASVAKGSHTYALQKTFAATTTSTKYLIARWKSPAGKRSSALSAIGDGVSLPLIAELPSSVSGYVNSYFHVAASSLAVTRFEWTGYADEPGSAVLSLDQVDISDVKPIVGTGRQQQRSLVVGGSARAPAALVLESATAALGDAILYVSDADESTIGNGPPMRQFRTAGNTVTADAARISGSREPMTPGVTFTVPVGLFPQGSYHLLGHMSSASPVTATVNITAKTTLGGTPIGDKTWAPSVSLTTTWTTFVLAKMTLPTVDLPFGSPASMELVIGAPSTGTPTYDEFWLFNVDLGCYIRVNCGTGAGTVGGSARRLFVKPESVAVPRKRILIGHSSDGSDAYFPTGLVTSWGFPQFKPPKVNVLAITPNATDAQLSMTYAKHWHTNPAE